MIIRDHILAEDIVQDSMIKIYKHRDLFTDIDSDKCRNLIYVITRNTAKDYYRKKYKRKAVEIVMAPDYFANVVSAIYEIDDQLPLTDEFGNSIVDYLSELSQEDRDIIVLYYGNGYSCVEIGKILNMKPNTVSKRMARARRKLSKRITALRKECCNEKER